MPGLDKPDIDIIWELAGDGEAAQLKTILQAGNTSVDIQDCIGYALVHAAVSYNHLSLVEMLVTELGILKTYKVQT
jgi:hypothetical protein